MSIKERREREKRELRESILTAAREIAVVEGWSGVSIRKIADRIEYSPPMIYEHFDDKDDLLYALMTEGFHRLSLRLRETRLAAANPEQALLDMAQAYWQFSVDSPELYQVMNGLDGVQFCAVEAGDKTPEFSAAGQEVIAALAEWGQVNHLAFEHLEDMLAMMWGALHGMVALAMGNRIQSTPQHTSALIQQVMQTLIAGWRCNSQ